MKEEILINAGSREVRAALVSDGILQGFLIERQAKGGVLGNIYKGKVSRVLPGMQAAFIDIGLSRTAFLHASDIVPSPSAPMLEGVDMGETDISRLIRDGQEVLVQVLITPVLIKSTRLVEMQATAMSSLISYNFRRIRCDI